MSRITLTPPTAPAPARTLDSAAKTGRSHALKGTLRGIRNCFSQLKSALHSAPRRDICAPVQCGPRYSAEVRNERASLGPLMLLKTTLTRHPLSPNTFQKANSLIDQAVADGATPHDRQSVFREVAILYPDSDFEQDLADIQLATQAWNVQPPADYPGAMDIFETGRIAHLLAHADDLSMTVNRVIADSIIDHFTSLPHAQGQALLSRLALQIHRDQARWEALNPGTAEFLYHRNDSALSFLTEGIDPEGEQVHAGPQLRSSAASVLLLAAWRQAHRQLSVPYAAVFDIDWKMLPEVDHAEVIDHIRLIQAALDAQQMHAPLLQASSSQRHSLIDPAQSHRSASLLQEATHQAFKRASTGQLSLQHKGVTR